MIKSTYLINYKWEYAVHKWQAFFINHEIHETHENRFLFVYIVYFVV